MEKLTLKHLAPYLPYGLKIKDAHGEITNLTPLGLSLNELGKLPTPILRPLSDLTKEEWLDGEVFTQLETFCFHDLIEADILKFLKGELTIWDLTYEAIHAFFKAHFDVFGLIDEGLAVSIHDINTIK